VSTDGTEILEEFLVDLGETQGDSSIILCGDFNARTGNVNTLEEGAIDDFTSDVFTKTRSSRDQVINEFGRSLLSPCLAHGLTILNGMSPFDERGCFTYVSNHGSSDYRLFHCF